MKIKVIPYNTLEYASLDAFPVTGESGKHYLALDTMLLYTWNSVTSLYVSADFRYEGKPTYHGSYLKSGYLEFTMVASPTPIDWHNGDYIRYDRTGRIYKLYGIPQIERQASTNHSGESFAYRNVQLYDNTKELSLVPFRDLIPGSGEYYFSSKQDVAFTGTVANVVERLNANLEAFFGEDVWNVRIADNIPESYEVSVAKDFSVSGMCIDALNAIYETWNELGWAYAVENGVNTIIIGYPNIEPATSGNRTNIFSYDNGLTALKRNNGGMDNFCTRMHVYGTERNLINRYYNGKDIYNAASVFIQNLMIPIELWGTTDSKPDARKAYIEDADKIALYGLITKDVYFDGTDGRPEIYPSIEQQTIEILKAAKTSLGKTTAGAPDYYPQTEDDTIRVDQIKAAVQMPLDDGTPTNSGEKYIDTYEASINSTIVNAESVTNRLLNQVQLFEYTFVDTGVVDVRWNGALKCVLDQALGEGDYLALKLCVYKDGIYRDTLVSSADFVVESDVTNGQIFNLDTLLSVGTKTNQVTGRFVVTLQYSVILANADSRAGDNTRIITITKEGDVLASANMREALISNFKIKTHQIGFDIAKMQSTGGATLAVRSGMCAGREFSIVKAIYNSDNDDWTLTCQRSQDTSTQTYYPNASFPIAADDEFVILGITMPEEYILAQAHRLYTLGQELFDKVSVFRPTFEPTIDSKKVLENITEHPSDAQYKLIEGKYMRLYDENLIDGNHNTDVLISEITINEGEAEIATYHVVLSDKATVTGGLSRTVSKLSTEVEKIQEAQRSQVRSQEQGSPSGTQTIPDGGSNVNPIYIKDGIPRIIDGLEVENDVIAHRNVEAMGGVAAHGMATLQRGGGGGMGTVTGIKFAGDPSTIYEPSQGLITLPDYPTAASLISDGLASQSYVQSYFSDNFTQANIKSTLGIYDWALAAYKPSYNFSEIGSKPTTLAGYGITDAHITSGVITLGGNTITPATLTNGKIPLSQIPDAILGQLIYGGTVNGSGVVTLSQNAMDKWGITSLTLTSTNYADYEGAFFIASADATSGVPSTLGLLVGDWVVATASGWGKIDNTDAVTGVKGDAESSYRIGNVNITKGNIGLGNVENTALSTWAGTSNITTLGTITTGVWHGTAIADDYIASASAWNAKYDKPSGGIPKTDLASGVQTSLGLADTALQSHQTIYNLIIKKNGTQVGSTYNPATAAQTIDLTDVASANALSGVTSRVGDLEGYFDANGVAKNALRLSNTSTIGDTNQPVYFTANGVPAAISYTIGRNVAANEDVTAYTAGSYISVNSHVISAKEASGSQGGVVTTSAQTFAGDKTFNDNIQSMKGVAARGMATLQRSGGGGSGTLTQIQINGTPLTDVSGVVNIPLASNLVNGAMSSADKSKLDNIEAYANNYVLPAAMSGALGGIRLGYSASGKNYPVQLDGNNKAYVNVPWENTTYSNGTGLDLSSGVFSINSTYQGYISNGNTAYGWGNHANAGYLLASTAANTYLPLSGGTMTGDISMNGHGYIASGRSTSYNYGYTFPSYNVDNTNSIGLFSGLTNEEGGVVATPDICFVYNSSDSGYNFACFDKDLGGDFTTETSLLFAVRQDQTAWSRGGFVKSGSDNNYVLLGGGGHAAISGLSVNYATSAGSATNNIEKLTWWYESDTHSVDNLVSGAVFAYTTHGAPTNGTIVSLTGTNNTYQTQIQGQYNGDNLWFRNKNDDNNTWSNWRYVIHSGNIASQSVNYATSAGNADTVDGEHASAFLHLSGGRMTGALTATTLTAGSTTIDKILDAIVVGPGYSRRADVNTYYPGIGFNHMLNYRGGTSYDTATHAWIGLRLYDTPGYERSSLVFATNSGYDGISRPVERMCIDPFGNVGIGTTSPSYILDVNGTTHTSSLVIDQSGGIYCGPSGSIRKIYGCDLDGGYYSSMASYAMLPDNDSDDCWQVRPWNGNRSNAYITVLHGGNVGIGTTSPSYKLHVAGDIYANGGWLRTSGAAGWYSETYGGGWYCDDFTYVKTYGSRSIYTANDVLAGGNIVANGGVAARGMATLQGGAGTGNPVTRINVGSTAYTPSSGVVSLPAYPTWSTLSGKPSNVSAFTNDSGYIDSSALAVTFTTTTLTSSSTSVYLNNTVQRDTLQKIIISSANNNQQFNIHLRGSGSYYGYHRQVYIFNQSGKDIYIQLTGVAYISMGSYVSVNQSTGPQLVNYNPISMDDELNYMYLLDIIQADSSEYPIVKVTHLDTWAD